MTIKERVEQTKAAESNGEDQQCRLGSYRRLAEQMGSYPAKQNCQPVQVEKMEKEIQAVVAAETMMRWQNKPVCREKCHHWPDRFGRDM